jgi:hypothetical protein
MRSISAFFSHASISVLVLTLSACAYVIPPDPNAPRHNTVPGEMRRPMMNESSLRSVNQAMANAAPLPPAAYVAPMQPSLPPVAPVADGRRIPQENQAFQLAGNYPTIDTVPPRPPTSGPSAAPERMIDTRQMLEQGATDAAQQANQLTRDAAAEPSMLSDLPRTDTVVPPSDPVQVVPTMPPAAPGMQGVMPAPAVTPAPPSVTSPGARLTPSEQWGVTPSHPMQTAMLLPAARLPATPEFAPPPPRISMPTVAPVPTATVAPSPVAPAASLSVPASPPTITPVGIRVLPGDFDPLAVSTPVVPPLSRYIPPSRYSSVTH